MKLLYFYFDFTQDGAVPEGYRGYTTCELNFGREFQYHLESSNADNRVYLFVQNERCSGEKIEPGFWGDNRIYNISALVGNNGAGKSMLIHEMIRCMMCSFHERIAFENLEEPPYPFAFFVEDEDGSRSLVYSRMNIISANPECDLALLPLNLNRAKQRFFNCGLDPQKPRKEYGILRKTKMIYFSNAITSSDKTQYDYWNYFESSTYGDYKVNTQYFSPLYDCSLIADMSEAVKISHAKVDTLANHLDTYFNFKSYQEVRYVFDRNQRQILLELRSKHHLPIPFPKQIRLTVLDPFHIADIDQDAHTMGQKEYIFTFYNNRIFDSNSQRLAASLSLNCLLEYCSCSKMSFIHDFCKTFSWDRRQRCNILFKEIINQFEKTREFIPEKEHYILCKKFVFFLWNNIQVIETFFEIEVADLGEHSSITANIQLGDTIDPCLEEFMIRFVNFGRAVSKHHYFIIYNWGLSSGEGNLLHMFTKLRYVLGGNSYDKEDLQLSPEKITSNNYELTCRREEKLLTTTDCKTTHDCDSVILFFDEADLTYHPEWQRLFISIITEFLPKVFPNPYYTDSGSGCKSFQVILSTHSPLLLGDFPSASITYLRKQNDGENQADQSVQLATFGENLYTILRDGFYLQNGTIGEFARRKIQKALDDTSRIQRYANQQSAFHGWTAENFDREFICLETHEKQTVQYLAKGIIREKLQEEIDNCRRILCEAGQRPLPEYLRNRDMIARVHQLEREKSLLEERIRALIVKEEASE